MLAGVVSALVGCASPRPGAPVVHRATPAAPVTGPAATVLPGVAPGLTPGVVPGAPIVSPSTASARTGQPPGIAPAVPAAPPPQVDAAPVRSGSVDARPLPTLTAPAALKSEPSAVKQHYSDALLARLQAAGTPVVPATATAPEAPPVAAAKGDAREPKSGPDAGAFRWPSAGKVLERFSEPRSMGIAIAGKPGDPVHAAADGKVIFSGAGPRSYGNLLIIKHDNDLLSVYAHNRALLVKEGQTVKRGQRVAELGDTGTDKPKLHFEIRRQGRPIDPLPLLPPREP